EGAGQDPEPVVQHGFLVHAVSPSRSAWLRAGLRMRYDERSPRSDTGLYGPSDRPFLDRVSLVIVLTIVEEAMILIGTAGWSYPSGAGKWTGVFYPEDRSVGQLTFYVRYFETG